MELNQWIETIGDAEPPGRVSLARLRLVASLLGENPRTVAAWYRKERMPRLTSCMNIILLSEGAVDWNGIFAPFARKLLKEGAKHADL